MAVVDKNTLIQYYHDNFLEESLMLLMWLVYWITQLACIVRLPFRGQWSKGICLRLQVSWQVYTVIRALNRSTCPIYLL